MLPRLFRRKNKWAGWIEINEAEKSAWGDYFVERVFRRIARSVKRWTDTDRLPLAMDELVRMSSPSSDSTIQMRVIVQFERLEGKD